MDEHYYVYVIGHEHATFGHALKVGISGNVGARLAQLQTGNADQLHVFLTLRFETRDIAYQIERLFHESELGGPIRGEWIGCDPAKATFYLCCITAHVLSSRYPSDRMGEVRRIAGLPAAFDIADRLPDLVQTELNDRYGEFLGQLLERGYN